MKAAVERVADKRAAPKSRGRQCGRTEATTDRGRTKTAAADRGGTETSATHSHPAATESTTMESAAKTSSTAVETTTVKTTAAAKSTTRRSRVRDQYSDRGERCQRDHRFA
jgi:hypothetical protein